MLPEIRGISLFSKRDIDMSSALTSLRVCDYQGTWTWVWKSTVASEMPMNAGIILKHHDPARVLKTI